MTLRLSEVAANDLENIYDFIAQDNADAALDVVEKLLQVMERLTDHSYLGRAAEYETRKLITPPFVIVYRILENIISVEAVLHGRRIH